MALASLQWEPLEIFFFLIGALLWSLVQIGHLTKHKAPSVITWNTNYAALTRCSLRFEMIFLTTKTRESKNTEPSTSQFKLILVSYATLNQLCSGHSLLTFNTRQRCKWQGVHYCVLVYQIQVLTITHKHLTDQINISYYKKIYSTLAITALVG